MASISPVIVPAKVLKGGKHKVRIAIAHNGETRYIVTDIIISSVKEFKNGTIIKRPDAAYLNTKIRTILQKYQSAIDEMEYISGLSCAELVFALKNTIANTSRTLYSVYNEYISYARIKESTKRTYSVAWGRINANIKSTTLMQHIGRTDIMMLAKGMIRSKLSSSTQWMTLNFLRTLINYAVKCGYVTYKIHPFAGYVSPKPEVRDAWLSKEELIRIRDVDIKKRNIAKCRDLFMLSYYLGGINMIDLLKLTFDPSNDKIKYIRSKSESTNNIAVEFVIPEEAKIIILHYLGPDNKLAVSSSQSLSTLKGFLSHNMPLLAKVAGLDHLIYYAARKSFAQHAFSLGISTTVIDHILGHTPRKNGSCLHHYMYTTPQMATEAIRKVLDNLK